METKHERGRRAPKHPLSTSEGARNIRPSQAGTKRLFSDRVSRLIDPSDTYDENDLPGIAPDEIHDEKRSRGSDWPLRKPSPLTAEPQHVQKDSASMHRSLSPARGSRFVEGSMNDRASKVPPSEFIGDEHLREAYSQSRARSRAAQQSAVTLPPSEKADTTRHSGIFRFGKSVAATFNPANWKIWKQPLQDETAQQKALRERQEKAERIYRELKETGKFRDASHPPTFHVAQYDGNVTQRDVKAGQHDSIATKHDSGIDFDNSIRPGKASIEEKRRGRVFLEPPILISDEENPYSDPSTKAQPRTSIQTTRPASTALLPSPRKLRSTSRTVSGSRRRSLSMTRLRKPSTTLSPRASESEDPSRTPPGSNAVHRIGSRSDLKKQKRNQRRLVKRVSDLEVKLAAARKELVVVGGDATGAPESGSKGASLVQTRSMVKTKTEPQFQPLDSKIYTRAPPVQSRDQDKRGEEETRITRPRFVPGALATLPSERLLSGYIAPDLEVGDSAGSNDGDEDMDVDLSKIGRALSTDYGERREGFEWPDYVF